PKSLSKSLFCTFTYVLGYFPSRMGCLVRLICPILADGCHANTGPSFRSFVSAMTEITSPAFDGHRALHSPHISFEFFPPKTEEMERSLWETINRLAPLTPNFVSVTYGAGGSTRARTHSTISRILQQTSLAPAPALTLVACVRQLDGGARHIGALRGDPTTGIGTAYHAHPDGYQSSPDLIEGIKKRYPDIEISVSAYPEKTPESPPLAHARRCSSITTSTSATPTASAPAASTFRSCPASCRCTISSRRATS